MLTEITMFHLFFKRTENLFHLRARLLFASETKLWTKTTIVLDASDRHNKWSLTKNAYNPKIKGEVLDKQITRAAQGVVKIPLVITISGT